MIRTSATRKAKGIPKVIQFHPKKNKVGENEWGKIFHDFHVLQVLPKQTRKQINKNIMRKMCRRKFTVNTSSLWLEVMGHRLTQAKKMKKLA